MNPKNENIKIGSIFITSLLNLNKLIFLDVTLFVEFLDELVFIYS